MRILWSKNKLMKTIIFVEELEEAIIKSTEEEQDVDKIGTYIYRKKDCCANKIIDIMNGMDIISCLSLINKEIKEAKKEYTNVEVEYKEYNTYLFLSYFDKGIKQCYHYTITQEIKQVISIERNMEKIKEHDKYNS